MNALSIQIQGAVSETTSLEAQTPVNISVGGPAGTEISTDDFAQPDSMVRLLHRVDDLLRNRASVLERILSGESLLPMAKAMALTLLFSASAFGAAMGLYRGGWQILYAAIKFPAALLITLVFSVPAYSAARNAMQQEGDVRADAVLALSSLALGTLVMAALTPIVVLGICMELSYHDLILLLVACCGLGGLVAGLFFVRGMLASLSAGRWIVGLVLLSSLGLVGSQASWTLRPYVVRPRTQDVPFVRGLEDNFFEAVFTTMDSARGLYWRESAPLPAEGRRLTSKSGETANAPSSQEEMTSASSPDSSAQEGSEAVPGGGLVPEADSASRGWYHAAR